MNRATDLGGDFGNGELRLENEVNGLLFDFGGKIGTRHRDGKGRRCADRTDAANYPAKRNSRNNASAGTLTAQLYQNGHNMQ